MNDLQTKITPINSAVSDKDGRVELFLAKYSVTHSLLGEANSEKPQAKIIVKTVTLGSFIKEAHINPQDVSCVKIDVEGAEYLVLLGMLDILKCRRTKIVIEIWDANVENYNRIEKLLGGLGFNLSKISNDNYLASPKR